LSSFLIEAKLAVNAVTSQYVHLSGETCHTFPNASPNQGHVSQGIRAHAFKQRSRLPEQAQMKLDEDGFPGKVYARFMDIQGW
jgi:hypothetical protein